MDEFSQYARLIDRELSSHRSPDVKTEDLFNLCKGGGEAALMALCAALVTKYTTNNQARGMNP